MAITPVSPDEVTRYVTSAEREREEPDPTVFLIRTVDLKTERKMNELARSGGLDNAAVLRLGLAGWENFDAAFEKTDDGLPTDETLEKIPFGVRSELTAAILDANTIGPATRKN